MTELQSKESRIKNNRVNGTPSLSPSFFPFFSEKRVVKKMEEKEIEYVVSFENGLSLSVVKNNFSYGLEVQVQANGEVDEEELVKNFSFLDGNDGLVAGFLEAGDLLEIQQEIASYSVE